MSERAARYFGLYAGVLEIYWHRALAQSIYLVSLLILADLVFPKYVSFLFYVKNLIAQPP